MKTGCQLGLAAGLLGRRAIAETAEPVFPGFVRQEFAGLRRPVGLHSTGKQSYPSLICMEKAGVSCGVNEESVEQNRPSDFG